MHTRSARSRSAAWALGLAGLAAGCSSAQSGPPDVASVDAHDGAVTDDRAIDALDAADDVADAADVLARDVAADARDAATDAGAPRARVASFVVQTQPASLDDPFNRAQPAEIAALGANGISLAYYFYQSGRFNTSIDNVRYDGMPLPVTAQPTMAQLAVWARAVHAAGLRVTLKPHLQVPMGTGTPPPWMTGTPAILPGGLNQRGCATTSHPMDLGTRQINGRQIDGSLVTVSASATGVVTASSPVFTTDDVGRRILTRGELPNTTLSNFGTVSPDPSSTGPTGWNRIVSVLSPRQVQLAQAPAASVGAVTLFVINDEPTHGAHQWFLDWQSKLDAVLAVLFANGGCDWLNLSTEQRYLAIAFEAEFRAMISHFRAEYPTLGISIGPNQDDGSGTDTSNLVNYELAHFWDALGLPDGHGGGQGLLAIDAYMAVEAMGDPEPLTAATVRANWTSATAANGHAAGGWIGAMERIRAAWLAAYPAKQFPWLFTEIGYRTTRGAGIHPDPVPLDYDPMGVDQAACIQGMFDTVWTQPWFLGFNYWAWETPGSDPLDMMATTSTFSPRGNDAVGVFTAQLR